jgi:hypothetical protein
MRTAHGLSRFQSNLAEAAGWVAVLHVAKDFSYTIHRIVGGFDPSERFYELWAESDEQSDATLLGGPAHYYKGYLQILPEDGH